MKYRISYETYRVDFDVHLLGGKKGVKLLVGEGFVSGQMGAAKRVLGPEGETSWVPCSPVTLILSGGPTKRRTSCHSPRSFDVPLQSSHHFRVVACFGS